MKEKQNVKRVFVNRQNIPITWCKIYSR